MLSPVPGQPVPPPLTHKKNKIIQINKIWTDYITADDGNIEKNKHINIYIYKIHLIRLIINACSNRWNHLIFCGIILVYTLNKCKQILFQIINVHFSGETNSPFTVKSNGNFLPILYSKRSWYNSFTMIFIFIFPVNNIFRPKDSIQSRYDTRLPVVIKNRDHLL